MRVAVIGSLAALAMLAGSINARPQNTKQDKKDFNSLDGQQTWGGKVYSNPHVAVAPTPSKKKKLSTTDSTTNLTTGVFVENAVAASTSNLASILISSPPNLELAIGQTITLTAVATFADGTTGPVPTPFQWWSSSTDVAQVDNTGLVTAYALGNVCITVVSGDVTSNCANIDIVPSSSSALTFLGYISWSPQYDSITAVSQSGALDFYSSTGTCPADTATQPSNATLIAKGFSTSVTNSLSAGTYCFWEQPTGDTTLVPTYYQVSTPTSASKTTVVMTKQNSLMTQVAVTVAPRSGKGTPTGTIDFTFDTYDCFKENLTNGTVIISMPTAMLKGYNSILTYSGDKSYGQSNYTIKPASVPQ